MSKKVRRLDYPKLDTLRAKMDTLDTLIVLLHTPKHKAPRLRIALVWSSLACMDISWGGICTSLLWQSCNDYKIKVRVGQLFERKIGGSDTQFAYITPTDVDATEFNAKLPPESWVDFEDTLKLEFRSAAAAVDQAAARDEAAASSSGAEASCSVGCSCDRVAEVVDEVVRHTPLTNGKEPERPYLGRQTSMRDQAAAAGRPAAPAAAAVPLAPRSATLPTVPPVPAPVPAPAPAPASVPAPPLAPAPAAPVYFQDGSLPLASTLFGGLTMDVAHSVSWLDEFIDPFTH
jgi:hypothetical protein